MAVDFSAFDEQVDLNELQKEIHSLMMYLMELMR